MTIPACLLYDILSRRQSSIHTCSGASPVPSLLVHIILQLRNLGSSRFRSLLPAGSLLLDAAHLLLQVLYLPIPLQPPLALLVQRLLQALVGRGTLRHDHDVRIECLQAACFMMLVVLLLEVPYLPIALQPLLAFLIQRLLQALGGWRTLQHDHGFVKVQPHQTAI